MPTLIITMLSGAKWAVHSGIYFQADDVHVDLGTLQPRQSRRPPTEVD